VVERQYTGGACPNTACPSSKNFILSAKVSSYVHRLREFWLEAAKVTVNMPGILDRKHRMVDGQIEGNSDLFA
jgi:pyruvate/2-oxoglutarate dehydrogenase complex dihydrolipoamide dehydrogenase (E3) component